MHMRFMLTFRFPAEKGNELAREGSLGQTIRSILEDINPEAAYLADMEGARGIPSPYHGRRFPDPRYSGPPFPRPGGERTDTSGGDPGGLGHGDTGDRTSGAEVRLGYTERVESPSGQGVAVASALLHARTPSGLQGIRSIGSSVNRGNPSL